MREMLLDTGPLVALAEERSITEIATLDRKDFGVYRTAGRKGFTVIPD